MYRSILLSLLFFSSTFILADPSKAQITVNSNGAVGINSNPNNNVSLRVVKSGYSYFSYGVQGIIDGGADYSYGVYGNAKNAITNHGVYGEATNSNAVNFGVYGKAENGFMSNYGIYGTASGTDSWAGYFNGDVYASGSYSSSDERLKKDIMALNNADMLTKITELQPRKYSFYPAKN